MFVVALQQLIRDHQPLMKLTLKHTDTWCNETLIYDKYYNGHKRLRVKFFRFDDYFFDKKLSAWSFFLTLFAARNDFNDVQCDYAYNMTENELTQLITLVKSSHSLLCLSLPDSFPGQYNSHDVVEKRIDRDTLKTSATTWRTTQNYFDDIVAACDKKIVWFVRFANCSMYGRSVPRFV